MLVSPLNLISTPAPVLNSLGLDLKFGLSSEDPMVGRHPSEPYEAYLSIYSPEGLLSERLHLGHIPANRRRMFDITEITRKSINHLDHLTVVHRIPSRLVSQSSNIEDAIEMDQPPDYSFFRSVVEYSYPSGGNGSVIYETPSGLNIGSSAQKSSNTLVFTCQTVISNVSDTFVILSNYSMDPDYSTMANFKYTLYTLAGEQAVVGSVAIAPFSTKILDIAGLVPEGVAEKERDPLDGLSAFTFVGYSEDASIPVFFINASPSLGAVTVEHTHPPQSYLFPFDVGYQRRAKADARSSWSTKLAGSSLVKR